MRICTYNRNIEAYYNSSHTNEKKMKDKSHTWYNKLFNNKNINKVVKSVVE